MSIVLIFLVGTSVVTALANLPWNVLVAILGGGISVALVGWWDDHGHVAVPLRLSVHLVAAVWTLWWLGGVPPVQIGEYTLDLGVAGDIIGLLAIVWLINLYNFMDGIDGLASVEAVFVTAVAGAMLYAMQAYPMAGVAWLLAASAGGFLVWNWPPAQVFMGDVGSGFLGYILAALILATAESDALTIWLWLILLSVFVVDATTTLLCRILRRFQWYKAHRSHAYQHVARSWGHQRVTVGIFLLNILWLAPLAWVAWRWPVVGFYAMLVAWAPLSIAAVCLRAGMEES